MKNNYGVILGFSLALISVLAVQSRVPKIKTNNMVVSQKDKRMIKGVFDHDLKRVQKSLKNGANPNVYLSPVHHRQLPSGNSDTHILWVAINESIQPDATTAATDIVLELIKTGADTEVKITKRPGSPTVKEAAASFVNVSSPMFSALPRPIKKVLNI